MIGYLLLVLSRACLLHATFTQTAAKVEEGSNKENAPLWIFSGDNLDIQAQVSRVHFVLLIMLYAFRQQCTFRNQSALRIYTTQPIRISVKDLGVFSIINILNLLLGFLTNSFENGV